MTISAPPTHPGLLQVRRRSGDFASSLHTLQSFSAGQIICPIGSETTPAHKAYTSVQIHAESSKVATSPHIELNSDLVFANHACDPSVTFEVPADRSKWAVRAITDLEPGDAITFFYPSTEWSMEQPFECNCGSPRCLGRITGARDLPQNVLSRYRLNDHIRDLKKQQIAES